MDKFALPSVTPGWETTEWAATDATRLRYPTACAPNPMAIVLYNDLCTANTSYWSLIGRFVNLWLDANMGRPAGDENITWPGDGAVTSVDEAFDRLFSFVPQVLMLEDYFMATEKTWGEFHHMLSVTHENIIALENFKLTCAQLFQFNIDTLPDVTSIEMPTSIHPTGRLHQYDEAMFTKFEWHLPETPIPEAWEAWRNTATSAPAMVQPNLVEIFDRVSGMYGKETWLDMKLAAQLFLKMGIFDQFLDLRDPHYTLFYSYEEDAESKQG